MDGSFRTAPEKEDGEEPDVSGQSRCGVI